MDGSGACAGGRSQLGVYLTGAIAPADRAAVVRHLATCADCRAELAGLAALPALLRRPPARAAAQAPALDGPGLDGPGLDEAAGRERGEAQLGRLLRSVARRRRRHRWLLAAIALVLAAVAGTGWGVRLAGPQAPAPQTAGTVLETLNVGGVTVLTDAEGYTLYWFGPDTAAKSACDAGCARQWPPVTGLVAAGTGVTGTIGAIARPDGALQATYDGHPLYTAIEDTGPDQTKGNGVWSGGGVWHEVTVPGSGAPANGPPSGPSPAPSAGGYGY
jgi:predicted lipoprotein with Yx(FWY)xxD motif